MYKAVLPPRARLANHLLFAYLIINALVIAFVAISNPFFILFLPIQAAIAAGVFFRLPAAYLVLMGVSFIGLVLSLHGARLIEAAVCALLLWLAFYIRSNLYVRVSDDAGEGKGEGQGDGI